MARDINDACTFYDPARPFTPDDGTAQTVEAIEKAGVPTINMVEEMQKARLWKKEWIVDPVRLTPWGTQQRPYFFEKSVSVALTCPWVEGTEIHYTLDGSTPTMLSARYEKPVPITSTTSLRAGAFRKGRLVSLIGSGYFVHLEPVPPLPDVYLDQLTPIKEHYDNWYSSWHPVTNQSFSFKPLLMRGKSYEKGIGMRAPSIVRYELKPEYDRFVARVGVDGNLRNLGPEAYGLPANGTSNRMAATRVTKVGQGILHAQQSSVQFRVFIDGKLAAESPVMRFSQEPWRFDVKIPTGSRLINLVCMDAGSRSILDLGNWVDAGFCTK